MPQKAVRVLIKDSVERRCRVKKQTEKILRSPCLVRRLGRAPGSSGKPSSVVLHKMRDGNNVVVVRNHYSRVPVFIHLSALVVFAETEGKPLPLFWAEPIEPKL